MEGINSRLDGIQAAVLKTKLPHILNWTAKRIKVSEKYNEMLQGVGDIITSIVRKNSKHSYHLYVIRSKYRDDLISFNKCRSRNSYSLSYCFTQFESL